jgi:hypothetical protein
MAAAVARRHGEVSPMSTQVSGRFCLLLLGLLASLDAAAGCGHNRKHYAEGGITCTAHHQFQCEHGAWHMLPAHCDADPAPPAKPPTGKDAPPAKTTPSAG